MRPKLGQFLEHGRYRATQGIDQSRHHGVAAVAIVLAVGGDDLLVHASGQLDGSRRCSIG
jgi:hypothetical protein